jgi:NAD(P)-dependent dehydrogenase (short-subunit alcohol dehydrogenase family)
MLLDGRTALITGAASGLGAETARVFAEQGARVVLCDVVDDEGEAVAQSIRDAGGDARFVHVDVQQRDSIDAAVALAEQELGGLNAVVANAGILGEASFRPSDAVTDEQWARVIDVNLSGVFRTFRAAIPALRRSGGGAMSATSSIAGVFGVRYRLAYTATKGGINAIVRGLAAELGPERIRVNAVAPGSMGTNIGRSLGRERSETTTDRPGDTFKAAFRPWEGRSAVRDVANVHLFLCSDLSLYVNGETIVADGGFSIWNGT